MRIKLLALVAIGLSVGLVAPAEAKLQPVWTNISPATSPITVSWINGNSSGTTQVTYSPSATGIWSYDGNLPNQNPSVIEQNMVTQFGLSSGTLSQVVLCGNASTCTTGGDGTTHTATWSTGKNYYDYLAVHYGQGELFFHFAKPIDSFSIQGLHNGLSNFYGYSDGAPAPAVPEPMPVLLLAAGLAGLIWRQRRS